MPCSALEAQELHSNSSVGRRPDRRSWHLFEGVKFDGCPGFKGPDPQPVSMSASESRGRYGAASRRLFRRNRAESEANEQSRAKTPGLLTAHRESVRPIQVAPALGSY